MPVLANIKESSTCFSFNVIYDQTPSSKSYFYMTFDKISNNQSVTFCSGKSNEALNTKYIYKIYRYGNFVAEWMDRICRDRIVVGFTPT